MHNVIFWWPKYVLLTAGTSFNVERNVERQSRYNSEQRNKYNSDMKILQSFSAFVVLSERERTWNHVHVRYMLRSTSIHRLRCRLSFVCLSVTLVHPTQVVAIFGSISTVYGTLAIHWHLRKILRRSSQGNPSVGAGVLNAKRGSQI